MTVASEHTIDAKQLEKMNAIFFTEDDKKGGETDPPIYIAVCPSPEKCQELVLKPPAEVLAARRIGCRVYVGYYGEAMFATAADGPNNYVPINAVPPPSPYETRKRLCPE